MNFLYYIDKEFKKSQFNRTIVSNFQAKSEISNINLIQKPTLSLPTEIKLNLYCNTDSWHKSKIIRTTEKNKTYIRFYTDEDGKQPDLQFIATKPNRSLYQIESVTKKLIAKINWNFLATHFTLSDFKGNDILTVQYVLKIL